MNRKEKLKLENMKKANELLDKGHSQQYPTKEPVELQPSSNVRNTSKSFVSKMNGLHESNLLIESEDGVDVVGELRDVLKTWETKDYTSDESRWKEYYSDIEKVVQKYTVDEDVEANEQHSINANSYY